MGKKTKTAPEKGSRLTQAELHQFSALHARVETALECLAHAATRARMAALEHELALVRLGQARTAAQRAADARAQELDADVQAAKAAAQGFAQTVAQAYDVDLRTHAVHPLTGEFVALPEDPNAQPQTALP